MNLHLPDAVQTYFAVSNGGDISRLAACFCADARVTDENRTHRALPPSQPGNRTPARPSPTASSR